ncbi:MAG: LysE family transporter [Ignavibacteriales bacterium]|nr:LysE family transporter [Ignavibacteriales bacterium]
MLESFITLGIIGLIAGFIFSMPIAGPISIIITSNALKGRYRFCRRAAVGAAIVEFFYVFIGIYGVTSLYTLYSSFIPYILLFGALVILFIGVKIMRTKIHIDEHDDEAIINDKLKNKGGLRTGLILNATNPSLILNWVMSSFIAISFATSLGFNTGGLDDILNTNINTITNKNGTQIVVDSSNVKNQTDSTQIVEKNKYNVLDELKGELGISLFYSFGVASGSVIWFFIFAFFLSKYRAKIKVSILQRMVQILGLILLGFGIYLIYQSIMMLV